eukprot:CAMPEP_0184390062 /NCGR_PEP_ID=MMETSP0007-20130409/13017_1 /TAXON_ID=97485 /ORGANISM="Prymnesium parvum, Strain Texoma1" /LENGTH=110 /DNA_ID=CAMNT_0026739651 /DNA_START=127 /DNA_END=460 /DNA_ORIENTATION=-
MTAFATWLQWIRTPLKQKLYLLYLPVLHGKEKLRLALHHILILAVGEVEAMSNPLARSNDSIVAAGKSVVSEKPIDRMCPIDGAVMATLLTSARASNNAWAASKDPYNTA